MCGAGLRTRGRGAAPEEDGDLGDQGAAPVPQRPGDRQGGEGGPGHSCSLAGPEGALALFWAGDQVAFKPE